MPSSLFRRWQWQGLGWGNEIGGPSEPRLSDPVSATLLATQVPHVHRCPAGPGRRPLHVLPLLHLPTDRQVPRAHHPAVPPAGRGIHALRHRRPCPAQGEPRGHPLGPSPPPRTPMSSPRCPLSTAGLPVHQRHLLPGRGAGPAHRVDHALHLLPRCECPQGRVVQGPLLPLCFLDRDNGMGEGGLFLSCRTSWVPECRPGWLGGCGTEL